MHKGTFMVLYLAAFFWEILGAWVDGKRKGEGVLLFSLYDL
jgi:hypothetical protein